MNKPNNGGTKSGPPPIPKPKSEVKEQLADKIKAQTTGSVITK